MTVPAGSRIGPYEISALIGRLRSRSRWRAKVGEVSPKPDGGAVKIGDSVGQYLIVEKLGEAGMGEVATWSSSAD